ncbi:ribonuclease H [Methylobacillus sp. Pita2]|uniref:ribonuclease H family protein n=1 Tax=Methylobacillus sp. Pita2 TaxID=3383245 RepID=UPI0038B4F522
MTDIVFFADGASKGNPGRAGWGVVLYKGQVEAGSKFGGSPAATNNQMELTALIEALKLCSAHSGTKVTIYSDSEYVVKGATQWIGGWIKKNWKTSAGGPVLNKDLWMELNALWKQNRHVEIKWVKGHQDNETFLAKGNARADELANMGVTNPKAISQPAVAAAKPAAQPIAKPEAQVLGEDEMSDNELIMRSLMLWANYIETGSVIISATDAKNMNQPDLIKKLDRHQTQLIKRLRNLALDQLSNKTKSLAP